MNKQEDFYDLLQALELDHCSLPDLASAMYSPGDFYRSFLIPKRSGASRRIDSPFPSLGRIQKQILIKVMGEMQAHPAAYAFVRGRNALGHATCHLRGNELLTLDIKDFFPSITRQMVFQAFNDRGISSLMSQRLAQLCCLEDSLPQGACTSPFLSNLVFHSLDERLHRLAQSLRLVYSRYADDLAFSGPRVPRDLPNLVRDVLLSRGFVLNEQKIRLKILGAKKIITGVSISTGSPKVPKAFKRELRAQVFSLEKNENSLSSLRRFDPLIYEKTIGKLNYLIQIEPNNEYARRKKRDISEAHQRFLSLAPIDS